MGVFCALVFNLSYFPAISAINLALLLPAYCMSLSKPRKAEEYDRANETE